MFQNFSYQDKLLFTKHLSAMLKSGIPIAEALETLSDESKSRVYQKTVIAIQKDINNGHTLTDALKKHPHVFDSIYVNLVKVGEESGTLEESLSYLAQQTEKDHDFHQKVVSASLYPSLVFLGVTVVGGGVSFFVLPKLIDLFETLDTTLPTSTKILLWFAALMRDSGIIIFAMLFGLFLIFRFLITVPSIRFVYHKLLLALPVIGQFNKNVQMTVIARSVGVMLKSGLTLPQALQNTANGVDNLVYKKELFALLRATEAGLSLSTSLANAQSAHFPKVAVKMIGVGEKTGALDESFLYLGDYFEKEVDRTMKNLTTILEPMLLLVIGVVVAFVALAIISPIYQFTGSIQR